MGKGSKAPKPYTPTWQAGADQSYATLMQGATPWASSLPGQVIPGLNQVVSNVQNNPYAAGAQSGANDVAALAGGSVAPGMLGAANKLSAMGDDAYSAVGAMTDPVFGSARSAYHRGTEISDKALKMVDRVMLPGMQHAQTAWDQTQQAIPGLTGGMAEAQQLLANGFDPQRALYDREMAANQDQINAINSMYGLSGSAYGAGVAADKGRDFMLDWGDRQLGRQLSALQGYGQHTGQVTSNMTNLLNTGGNQYNSLMNGATDRGATMMDLSSRTMNQGVDNLRQGYATGANIYGGLNATAQNNYGAASSHAADALNTLYTSTQLPSSTYLGQQDAQIAALTALANGGGAALDPTNRLVASLGNYMQLGQSATQLSQQAVQMDNARRAAQTSALMSGIGTLAGAAMTGGTSLFGSLAAKGVGGAIKNSAGQDISAAFGSGG